MIICVVSCIILIALFVEAREEKVSYDIIEDFQNLSYPERLDILREYADNRFDGVLFMDFLSTFPLSSLIIRQMDIILSQNLFGNPHSESSSSQKSSDLIDDARRVILSLLGTSISQYTVVFTFSSIQALKLFAESYPLSNCSKFFYSSSSNINILGLRSYAEIKAAPSIPFIFGLNETNISTLLTENSRNVVFFPMLDEFDGGTVSFESLKFLMDISKSKNISIVSDLSSYLMFKDFNLTQNPIDAVTLDLTRLLGVPNIGALVIRNELVPILNRTYFGGGTLVYALTSLPYEKIRLRPSERFEDGTPSFLTMNGIKFANNLFKTIGFIEMKESVKSMNDLLLRKLSTLEHANGKKMIKFYSTNHSLFASFNVQFSNETIIHHQNIVNNALLNKIYLSSGCHLTPETCKVVNTNKGNRGAVRASVGFTTNEKDIDLLINWLNSTYYEH